MLKKDNEIKWTVEARKYFKCIKKSITEAPILVSPNFSKDFIVFSCAYEHTIAGVLLQKNQQNVGHRIAFFINMLSDGELKYDIMEKHVYALVKSLKDYRVCIIHSHIISVVPSNVVKNILTQPNQ